MPWDKYYGSKRIYDGMDVGEMWKILEEIVYTDKNSRNSYLLKITIYHNTSLNQLNEN